MQRWPVRTLPTNKRPVGTRCIQIDIPDDDEWELAMFSEVTELTRWMRWERDTGKNGKPVADIWLKALNSWRHCDGSKSPVHGMEVEDFMPLRVDCDCNVWVTCCDGTEKQIATLADVQQLVNGQPGGGSPQPQPGGGCQAYPAILPSGGTWLLPTLVNDGDTIQLSNIDGASTDVAPIGRWNCPDGQLFFGGRCDGDPHLDGSSLLPTSPIGALIYNIDGTWYPADTSPFTVPPGTVNKPVSFALNYATGGDYAGTVTFTVEVCNNQAATFRHVFNFGLNSAGFGPTPQSEGPGCTAAGANYTPGSGFTEFSCPSITAAYINIGRSTPTTHATHVEFSGEIVGSLSGPSDFELYLTYGGTEHLVATSPISGPGPINVAADGPWDITAIRIRIGVQPDTTSLLVSQFIVEGTGSDPF